ncbi:MAG: hypothetical protein HYY04_18435 [Chloroflexi bacterium]|nr:hypothetical protein [Chloroflexota bacterium]
MLAIPRRVARASPAIELGRLATRLALALLILSAPLWSASAHHQMDRFAGKLGLALRADAFQLVDWEVRALGGKLLGNLATSVPPPESPAAAALVRRYYALGAEHNRLRGEIDLAWAQREAPDREARLHALAAEQAARRAELRALEGAVEMVLGAQIRAELATLGFGDHTVALRLRSALPPVDVDVVPAVLFKLGPLPQALIVAPRDRIAIIHSQLVRSDLDLAAVEELERRVDGLGVSSLVTSIGGLAAYPSMILEGQSIAATLTAVSHEWVHHYFFVRPLGIRYFADYELRTINETAADLAGVELGRRVLERFYPAEVPPPAERRPRRPDSPAQPSFGDLMRAIRREVERWLATGDVVGAERYMGEQKAELAREGYPIRKLNTAYLSFFGSYSGGANPYEPKLRRLREDAGSLKAFLEAVARVDSPTALDRAIGTMAR